MKVSSLDIQRQAGRFEFLTIGHDQWRKAFMWYLTKAHLGKSRTITHQVMAISLDCKEKNQMEKMIPMKNQPRLHPGTATPVLPSLSMWVLLNQLIKLLTQLIQTPYFLPTLKRQSRFLPGLLVTQMKTCLPLQMMSSLLTRNKTTIHPL